MLGKIYSLVEQEESEVRRLGKSRRVHSRVLGTMKDDKQNFIIRYIGKKKSHLIK